MKKIIIALAASLLLAATAYAEQGQSALFLTPSVAYSHISQKSAAADYELSGNVYQLNVELEIISNGIAYHRMNLGHSFADSSTQKYTGVSEEVDIDHAHAAYNVGVIGLSSSAGDFSLWTGLGWQGTKINGETLLGAEPESTRMHYMYVPFGIELALHHAGSSFWVIGSEYRLVMRGWEKYQTAKGGHPQQSDVVAYSVWLGMDYMTSNNRALTTRLSFDQWKVDGSDEDEIAGGNLKLMSLELGVRF